MRRIRYITGSGLARLMTGYAIVAAVLAAAWLWSMYGPLTDAVLGLQERSLTAVAQSAALVAAQSSATPGDVARQLVARTDMRLTIVAADGTVLADSDRDPATMENHSDRPEVAAALRGETGVAQRTSTTEGDEQLYVAVPASLDGERIAVRVSQPLTEINAIASRFRRVGLLLLAVSLVVVIALAVPLARAASRPVQELSDAAARMAAGDLDTHMPPVPSDLEGLADSLGDLRDQMRARLAALDAERGSLRAALDGLSDAVMVLEGDRVSLANSAASRLFPASQNRSGLGLDDAGLPASLVAAIRDLIARGQTDAADLEADPLGRTLRLRVAPLDRNQPDGRVIAVVSDVTERARLDTMRRDFVSNASHELKTPVAGIRLLAESAATAASDGDDAQAVAFARQIAAETERLQRLVGELLDLSRLETAPEPGTLTDVRVAVENVLVTHRGAASRKALGLSADLAAVRAVDVFIAADPTDVAVALDNLVDNALAYTDAGEVRIVVEADDAAVEIRVQDTGRGIPAEDLPRIFERFYRVDRARSRDGGGTGLGLALVRHVAERNGGSVQVSSKPDSGSTFVLRLPRAF